jgi:hypothetical protein
VNWAVLEALTVGSGDGADDEDAGTLDNGDGTGVADRGEATAAFGEGSA